MKLRKATFEDWKILLDWRNDPITQINSFTSEEISEYTHKLWFNDSLLNERRSIYILEDNLVPLGSIRSDILFEGGYVLSWNISPIERGKGYGNTILELYLRDKKGEFIAEIKPGNVASIKMVKNNGFKQIDEIKYSKKQ